MPLLLSYRGRPVKRRRKAPQTDQAKGQSDHLLLIFVSPTAGDPGDSLVVSQSDWDRHGHEQFVTAAEKPDVRALAKQR